MPKAKNIISGWKTTVIGIVIIIASIVSVFKVEGVNWLDASIGIAVGAAFMMAPDKLLDRIGNFRGTDTNNIHTDDDTPPVQ